MNMEQVKPSTRVVPSGKVYRQIFDAEVQLVKALEKKSAGPAREPTKQSTVDDLQTVGQDGGRKAQSAGLPLVSALHTEGSSMLTERQKTWTQGFPNEPDVENPVLYKFYSEDMYKHIQEPESMVASKEVRGLPDVLTPAKTGSDIIERIAESRKQRHESAVEDMHQELGVISSELEPKIVEAGDSLMVKMLDNDKVIQEVMDKIDRDEDLMLYSLEDLEQLWEEASSHSLDRQCWINDLNQQLKKIEDHRMDLIRDVLQNYAKMLEKIAHLMAPDLQRLLDKESQMINQAVLSNRRSYADLHCRLLMSDIEREKKLHTQWRKRLDDWKRLHTDMAVNHFGEYMDSDDVVNPMGAATVLEQMRTDQQSLNQRRLDLVNSLTELKPPASTKTSVYKWNQQITDISKEIDQLNQQYFNKLYAEYEKVCQKCLGQVDLIKDDLIKRGVCTEARAQTVVNEQCLPLVGERQTEFEQALEEMDKSLEEHNSHVLTQLKSLFKYCQGAAHVWDVHEIGLAKQERALQQKLDECRHMHDNENQEREANLDLVMDKMRQDATEESLKESLRKALDMLNSIKDGYIDFHGKQVDIVSSYPEMVRDELGNYDAAVCRFFTVDRKNPERLQTREGTQGTDTPRKKKKVPTATLR